MRYGAICDSSTKKKTQNRNLKKKRMKNSVTESIKKQTSEEVKYEENTRFEERYREFERKIVQEYDTTTAARE